jgi:hypothetical protein
MLVSPIVAVVLKAADWELREIAGLLGAEFTVRRPRASPE